jgi:Protein of unknown function (DUF3667)
VRSDSPFCHNCGIRLTGPFCAACGQKALPLSVTLHDFFHEFIHEMLHVDGRIWQTIRHLTLSPGFLTCEYLQGRRARWISPIRLYLIFSVAFFALSALTGVRVGVTADQNQGGWNFSFPNIPSAETEVSNSPEAEAEVKELGFESIADMEESVDHAVLVWVPRVMFVLLPLFAWLVALTYGRIDPNYLHHLIFAVHVHAGWFAAAAIAKAAEVASGPVGDALRPVVIVFAVVYAVLAFRRVYGAIRFSFVRIAFVMVAYGVAIVLAFVTIVVPVVFRYAITRLL